MFNCIIVNIYYYLLYSIVQILVAKNPLYICQLERHLQGFDHHDEKPINNYKWSIFKLFIKEMTKIVINNYRDIHYYIYLYISIYPKMIYLHTTDTSSNLYSSLSPDPVDWWSKEFTRFGSSSKTNINPTHNIINSTATTLHKGGRCINNGCGLLIIN